MAKLAATRADQVTIMQQELVKTLIATTLLVRLGYVMVLGGVLAKWARDVVPVGKYLWAFMATIIFFAMRWVRRVVDFGNDETLGLTS